MHPSDPGSAWSPPSATHRKALLDRATTIAVIGASANPSRASNFVVTYLQSSVCDYQVFPVNPAEDEILGLACYPSLATLPLVPDVVNVFRRPEECPSVATEAVEVGASSLWLQLGVWSDEAASIAVDGQLDVVMDRCIKIEHARFAGGLHLAGFDTGVIDSRRQDRHSHSHRRR